MKPKLNKTKIHGMSAGKDGNGLSLIKAATLVLMATMLTSLAACHKNCICKRYTSALDTFSLNELQEMGYSCSTIENIDDRDTYVLCWED